MHTSIAERFAFGTPSEVADDTAVHLVPRSGTALIGRILISAIFIISGFAKLTDPDSAVAYMNMVGVPAADVLVFVPGLGELFGGLAILFGFLTRLAAILLAIQLVITTLYFHSFWAMEGAEAKMQMVQFWKNLAIIGGLALLFAFGPGRYSIDARVRRPKLP